MARWFWTIPLLLSLWAPRLEACRDIFVHISAMAEETFVRAAETILATQPVNRVPWLTIEVEPKILVSGETELVSIAEAVACCGHSVGETYSLLASLLYDGQISLQAYLEAAYRKADEKKGEAYPKDCMVTSLVHVHYLYAKLTKPSENHEALEHFLEPVADRSTLRWGDILVLREGGKARHAVVNLGNGIVLNKPGMAPARLEPLDTAMGWYTRHTSLEHLEIWRAKAESPETLYLAFSPRPRRGSFDWLRLRMAP